MTTSRPGRNSGRGIAVLVTAGAVSTAIAVAAAALPGAVRPAAADDDDPVRVAVVALTKRDVADRFVTAGIARAWEEVTLVAGVSGRLADVRFDRGDRIEANQPLAVLDVPELEVAVDRARARLEAARVDREITAGAAAAALEGERAGAELGLRLAETRIAEREAELHAAEIELSRRTLRAPFAGVIADRTASPGAFVRGGDASEPTALGRLLRVDRLRIVFDVPRIEARALRDGEAANVVSVVVSGVGGDRRIASRVSRLGAELAPRAHTRRCEAAIPGEDAGILPGSPVTVEVVLGVREGVPCLPRHVVHRDDDTGFDHFTYVVRDGRARRVEVEIGTVDGDWVEVTSGVVAGDAVIASSDDQLWSGREVEVRGD